MERWVSPPLVAREPAPRWVAVWRYRLGIALLAAVLIAICWVAWLFMSGATDQEPGVDADPGAGAVLLA